MKKAEIIIENKGFSLILVIICMTLIGVLASMIVATSVGNVQMRVVEEESSNNFYSAEEVLDEVKANMEKYANEQVGVSYTEFLKKYATTPPKKRESMFVESFANELLALFDQDFINGSEAEFLKKYLGVATGDLSNKNIKIGKASGVEASYKKDENEVITSGEIIIKGLTITYTENGYETTIKSDIVVKVTYPKFFENSTKVSDAFFDYAIITDSNIEMNAKTGVIMGSIYSGNDLVLNDGATLTVYPEYLIAKNSISVKGASKLKIEGQSDEELVGLWTKNIITVPKERTQNSGNVIQISNMNCYVQDDLTINGIGDKVSISSNSEHISYYGYGSGSGLNSDAAGNSAINVNAKDVVLTIRGLDNLWLAGQSFISVPEGYGVDMLWDEQLPIPQGESLSFKGNQAAYLLPGDSIEGVWHNPMTLAEYKNARKLIKGVCYQCNQADCHDDDVCCCEEGVDNDTCYSLILSTRKADSIKGNEMNLDQYLDIHSDTSRGDYTSRYVKTEITYGPMDSSMVYIYMQFSTPNAAKKYFEEYYNINTDLVNTRMKTIGAGSIVIDDSIKITTTGNMVVHTDDIDSKNPNRIISSSTSATASKIREADYAYSNNFQSLAMTLDANTDYFGDSSTLLECIFRMDSMSLLESGRLGQKDYNGQEYTLYVSNGDLVLDGTDNMFGLVLAKGNVRVCKDFIGLIIAQGTVTVENGAVVSSAPEAMKSLIGESDAALKSFFKYYDEQLAGLESKEAIDIYYDNWQKN